MSALTHAFDPSLDPLAIQPEVEARRFRIPHELYETWLGKAIPAEDVERIIAFATEHHLDLSAQSSDLRLMMAEGRGWVPVLNWSGIRRLCRFSGRWRPGKADYRSIGSQDFAFASCWTRDSLTSSDWYEVSAFARYASSFTRQPEDVAKDDIKNVRPTQEWALTPEIELDKVAQYNAAAKALGAFITAHHSDYSLPPVLFHADMIHLRQAEAAGSAHRATG